MSNTNGAGPMVIEMTTRDYTKVLFRQKWIILLTIVTVSLATYAGLELSTPIYEAQVKMLITAEKQIDSPYYRDVLAGRNVEATLTQSEIVKSKPVLERAVAALNLYNRPLDYETHFATPLRQWVIDRSLKRRKMDQLTPDAQKAIAYRLTLEDLKRRIKVEPVRDTNLFSITVSDFSPVAAAIIANTVSRAYVVFDLEQQYVELQNKYTDKNPIVIQMRENITKMEESLSGKPIPNIEAIGPASVKIIEQSTPPMKPTGLPKKMTQILAFAMSIFLGVFLAFMFEYLDQTFHSKQDLENFLGVPVIACINKKKGWSDRKLVTDVSEQNRSPRSASYRILTQQILFMVKTKNIRTLFFVSIHPKDDSSAILANVAVFLSKKLGLRTLVIDANLRHPHLHKIFDKKLDRGLTDVMEGVIKIEEAARPISEKLDFVPAGRSTTDPGILLDASIFNKALAGVKSFYDVVLIDGVDLRDFRDSALIAPCMDGVILVVGESTVRRQVVKHSVIHLRESKCRLAGVVMPNRHYLIPKFLYESV
jgi:capsular exopolysaccharide synthesis family protein